jgi:hypothetical protein
MFEKVLEFGRKHYGIEERQPLAFALEVLPELRKPIPIGAKRPQRLRIIGERFRDQFRHFRRNAQAGSDASRKRGPAAREQWHARPQRVAARRVRSIREDIEREIGTAQPRHVLGVTRHRREHDALGRHALRLRERA